jgi:hypothetical protein
MFDRIRGLFARKPSPGTQTSGQQPAAEAATVLAMGTQSGIAAVPGAALVADPELPAEDEPNPESEGAV